jgi:hypothetical protein
MEAGREEEQADEGRDHDERELDPEIAPDVVAAHREREADRGEHEGRDASERALEQYRPRGGAPCALVPADRLVDS